MSEGVQEGFGSIADNFRRISEAFSVGLEGLVASISGSFKRF